MVEEMKKLKPTHQWKRWQEEYEKCTITDEEIKSMNVILDDYIKKLMNINPNDDKEIMECVKEVVLAINDWDMKYVFIETIEREDLCDFIYKTAEMKGLETEEDITEGWRDW